MQTRLLACVAGGLVGVVLASSINSALGLSLSSTLAVIVSGSAGAALGCVASVLFDVFTGEGNKQIDPLK